MSLLFRTLTLALTLAALGSAAQAQVVEDKPDELQDVGIDDKRGDQIPLDLRFRTEDGNWITLADLFNGQRPILLSLNYSDCPLLCRVQLDGLCTSLKELEWTTGQEFDVVSVSINPREMPERAKRTETRYLTEYGRAGAAAGWHFLTGKEEDIQALADAVGFRYKYVPARDEYAHTAAVMVCTPGGVVSRYLYGVMYDPTTVRLSLVEAADGRVGSALDKLILFCFHYDETQGRYGPVARKIMSLAGGVTVLAVAACLLPFWVKRRSLPHGNPASVSSADSAAPPQSSHPQAT